MKRLIALLCCLMIVLTGCTVVETNEYYDAFDAYGGRRIVIDEIEIGNGIESARIDPYIVFEFDTDPRTGQFWTATRVMLGSEVMFEFQTETHFVSHTTRFSMKGASDCFSVADLATFLEMEPIDLEGTRQLLADMSGFVYGGPGITDDVEWISENCFRDGLSLWGIFSFRARFSWKSIEAVKPFNLSHKHDLPLVGKFNPDLLPENDMESVVNDFMMHLLAEESMMDVQDIFDYKKKIAALFDWF